MPWGIRPEPRQSDKRCGGKQQRQGHWHRSKTHSGAVPPKPPPKPISVSATSKSKLQKFQFDKDQTKQSSPPPTSENEVERDHASKGRANSAVEDGASNKENLSTSDLDLRRKDTPAERQMKPGTTTTPISRLAWQDLMGAADAENHDEDTSPNERLLWHNDFDLAASNISPLVPRRGKKRARSSSPISSSPASRTPAVNVKRLKQALKSPNADPALELWDRFAVNGPDTKCSLGTANPALAHLMVSSSPRPTKDGTPSSGESSLRRAMSCGSHWPKRRQGTETITQSGPAQSNKETTKLSMVTALLQTVNGEINKTEELEEEDVELESPLTRKQRSPMKPTVSTNRPATGAGSTFVSQLRDPRATTSDYDDDDFDDDTIWEELDTSLLSGQVQAESCPPANNIIPPKKVASSGQGDLSEDDFDDLDDDVLAAAEELIAEGRPKQTLPTNPDNAATTVHLDGGTEEADDVYGDDFGGDFDFAAAELAATQSVGQPASSLCSVRTIR